VGHDVSISELAHIVSATVGYTGGIVFDTTKPDGTPRKLMDVRQLTSAGWNAKTTLKDGLACAYTAFKSHETTGQGGKP